MLKITTKTKAVKITFELEGKLAGAWVNELERCWRGFPAVTPLKFHWKR